MKHLRRPIWHIASRLLIITLVLGLLVTGFYYAMNMTNIYIVLKDGMARRAQVVMMTEDMSELKKYFYDSFLSRDGAVQTVSPIHIPQPTRLRRSSSAVFCCKNILPDR